MRTIIRYILLVTVYSLSLCFAQPSCAATRYWTRPAGDAGNWFTSSNWDGGRPTSSDIATIVNGGTVTITQEGAQAFVLRLGGGSIVNQLGGSLSVESLSDQRDSFTYNISGGLLTAHLYYSGTINQSGGKIVATRYALNIGGGRGPAYYITTGGILEAPSISVGATSGGTGTMSMSNSSAGNPVIIVTGSNGITVGGGDEGTLNMSGGTLQVLTGPMTLGSSDTGIVNQTGGLISCTGLFFGRSFGRHSYTYNLKGGTLVLSFIELGSYGTYARSAFNFGGGTLQAGADFSTTMPMRLTGQSGNANLDTDGFEVTLAGQISGIGGLNKHGLNTLVLSAANTYTGTTVINGGTLQVDGSLASTGTVTVQNRANLSGTGAAGHVAVTSGGQIAPGDAPGTLGALTFNGGLTLSSGALLNFDLSGPSNSDRISMPFSTLFLNGQQFSDFSFRPQIGFVPGIYTLIDADLVEGFLGDEVTGMIGSHPASLSIRGGDLLLTVVPEPSATMLASVSICYFLALHDRNRLGSRTRCR